MGNNNSFKCCIFFMAVTILIQGCVYLSLSVWGFMLSECSNTTVDTSTEPIKLIFELIYFKKDKCGSLALQSNVTEEPLILDIDWNKSDKITNRTFNVLVSYAVLSSLWILTSLLVISSICGPINKLVTAICFWPWFIAVFAGSALDVVATGYHSNDLFHTMNIESTLDYIGILGNESKEIFRPFGMLFMAPALILTCLSSRFILIWLFNTFGSCVCISLYRNITQKVASPRHRKITNRQSISRNSANETQAPQASSKNDKLQQFTQTCVVAEKCISTESADDALATILKTSANEAQTPQDPSKNDNCKQSIPVKAFRLPSSASSNRSQPYVVTNIQKNIEAADNVITTTSSHLRRIPSKLNVNNNSSNDSPFDATHVRSIHRHEDEIPTNILPKALPNTSYITPHVSNPPYSPNARINELRGQLPWSYINMPKETPRVNIYPDIPTPDY